MDTRQKIILADDHDVVRAGLREAFVRLEPNIEVVETADLDQTLARIGEDPAIELCILDLYMPGMNGVEGIDKVKSLAPGVPVAVISGSIRRADVEDVLAAGVSGFIPKTMTVGAIVSAIRLILSGEKYLPYQFAEKWGASPGEGARLTPRELEALKAVAAGKTNKEIARSLGIVEVTVKLHVKNACRKLEVSNRTHAAMKARDLGLI